MNEPLDKLMQRLSGNHGEEWLDALERFNNRENPWSTDVALPWPRRKSALLELITTLEVPEYSVKPADILNDGKIGNAKINLIGKEIRRLLVQCGDRVLAAAQAKLNIYRLCYDSVDPIILEILGDQQIRLGFVHLCWLIEQQSQGQPGTLLVNGNLSIFYLEEFVNLPITTGWSSGDGTWDLYTYAKSDPEVWDANSLIVTSSLSPII